MSELIDLARPEPQPEETKAMTEGPSLNYEKYSWSTRFTLRDEELSKLGINLADYKIGDELVISAQVKVIEIASSESEGVDRKHTDRRLELQITHMALPDRGDFNDMFNEAAAERTDHTIQPGAFR